MSSPRRALKRHPSLRGAPALPVILESSESSRSSSGAGLGQACGLQTLSVRSNMELRDPRRTVSDPLTARNTTDTGRESTEGNFSPESIKQNNMQPSKSQHVRSISTPQFAINPFDSLQDVSESSTSSTPSRSHVSLTSTVTASDSKNKAEQSLTPARAVSDNMPQSSTKVATQWPQYSLPVRVASMPFQQTGPQGAFPPQPLSEVPIPAGVQAIVPLRMPSDSSLAFGPQGHGVARGRGRASTPHESFGFQASRELLPAQGPLGPTRQPFGPGPQRPQGFAGLGGFNRLQGPPGASMPPTIPVPAGFQEPVGPVVPYHQPSRPFKAPGRHGHSMSAGYVGNRSSPHPYHVTPPSRFQEFEEPQAKQPHGHQRVGSFTSVKSDETVIQHQPQALMQLPVVAPSQNLAPPFILGQGTINPMQYHPPGGVQQWHVNPRMGQWFLDDHTEKRASPKAYMQLTWNGVPDIFKLADEYMPFVDAAENKKSTEDYCVLKVTNIPYDVQKNEIIASLGNEARVVCYPENTLPYWAVHIIFDRHLGKTCDAYVECPTQQEARNTWSSLNRYLKRTGKGRVIRNRVANFEIVNAGELSAILFPKAKCTIWRGSEPIIREPEEDYESPFEGFITDEELRNLLQHARRPGQGQHGKEAPQRPFEDLISIIQKYPWHRTDLYTVQERDSIFYYVLRMTEELVRQVRECKENRGVFRHRHFATKINQCLLEQLVTTACSLANFTWRQQHQLVAATGMSNTSSRVDTSIYYPLFRLAPFWPFESLTTVRGVDEKIIEYYAHLIQISTTSPHCNNPTELIWALKRNPVMFRDPFGGFSIDFHGERRKMRMAKLAEYEISIVRHLLFRLTETAKAVPALEEKILSWTKTRIPYAGPF